MVNLTNLLSTFTEPSGLWANLIRWVYSFAGNYALTIILITVIIRIIMLPIDVWQKTSQKIYTNGMARVAPEIEAIKKRYQYDKATLNSKTMECYKRNGVSQGGYCLSMLVYFGLTLWLFISLINGINTMSYYKIEEQYYKLSDIYHTTYTQVYDQTLDVEEAKSAAKIEVQINYKDNKEVRESFLWIKNIWRKDSNQSIVPKYKDVVTKDYNKDLSKAKGFYTRVTEAEYNEVMGDLIESEKGWNGYFILAILAVATTFITSKITANATKAKKKTTEGGVKTEKELVAEQTGKITQFIMPVVMGILTLTSTSIFAIYLVASQIIGIGTTYASLPLVNYIAKKLENKRTDDTKPTITYSR